MLTAEKMATLKKVNISKDAEKSKTRIAEDFKSTTSENKKAIENLSGLKRNTFYRVFETGNATARVVLSIAQILNASPYYYTGAEDDKGECSDEVIEQFLKEHGYEGIKTKRKYTRKSKDTELQAPEETAEETAEEAAEETAEETTVIEEQEDIFDETAEFLIELNDSEKMNDAVNNLDEDTAVLLLKSLMKRSVAGGNAEILCDIVMRCLLS